MNINCVICSDLFEAHSEVYSTQCGHTFHYACLMHWMERSKSCPQCRNKCTDKTIHRVYFNISNTEHIKEDVGTLQSKLDNLNFQIKLKDKDIKNFGEKYTKIKKNNAALREEVQQLEHGKKVFESAIHALKDQLSYFKSKAKDVEKIIEENQKLKTRLKDVENVQQAINGSRAEVNEMIKNQNNIESLAILAAMLKKSLLEAERKKRDSDHTLKQSLNDVTKYRREANTFECQYNEMKTELEQVKTNWNQEKQYLKNKIVELDEKLRNKCDTSQDITNSSIKRIMDESPINFNRRPKLTSSNEIDLSDSPLSMSDKVNRIINSDSPYVPVKSSSVGIALLNTKYTTKPSTSTKYTIFKPVPSKLENVKLTKQKSDEVNYNGFGGTSKDDFYPSPKPTTTSLKRHKSQTHVPSSKFRKLSANKSKNSKLTDFVVLD
ncbi:unnamed protein product [Brassicogethes aeneus]|uniref:RING-type domain-containing protein n=1 Tax=Brassicogethes aeneus TaxID=1431903 RepID=A0A9P0B0I5_BRAAE|nr:unnamed protein product [Brassicogethes aeneus]